MWGSSMASCKVSALDLCPFALPETLTIAHVALRYIGPKDMISRPMHIPGDFYVVPFWL